MSTVFAIALALLAAAPTIGIVLWTYQHYLMLASRRSPSTPGPVTNTGAQIIALISALGCLMLVVVGVSAAIDGSQPLVNLGGWLGFGHDTLGAGGISAIFMVLTGIAGTATSLAYAELRQSQALTTLASLLLLAVAVAIGSGNAFVFLLAWEGLGVCIYLLTSADRDDPQALLGGYLTAGLTKLGGAALLAAIALLYAHTHTFSIDAWSHAALSSSTRGAAFLLFLVAFGSKVGLLPIQGGVPAGYSAAPGLGAASLSVALSAGFYGLWRFEIAVLGPLPYWCGDVLLVLGALTAMTGIVYAVTQDQLRRFLGYSSVEHAGIVLLGLGVALLGQSAHKPMLAAVGLLAATLHVCAHNLGKTLALLGVAYVERTTGHKTLDPLGGLAGKLPAVAAGVGIASMTLCALPPLGGFVSEWFTFEALLQGFRMPSLLAQLLCALAAACLALTAGIGLLAFAKFYSFAFLGPQRSAELLARAAELPKRPLSLISLGLILLFLGAVAPWEIRALGSALHGVLGINLAATTITYPLTLGPVFKSFSVLAPTWLMIVLPGYALLAVLFVRTFGSRRGVRRAPVWVTGSRAELARVQYRPSAYSNPLRVVLQGPLGLRTAISRSDADSRRLLLRTEVVYATDRFLYEPLTRLALAASGVVRRMQHGRLSIYLLYMLVALIVALALIPILR
jgi:hydrogenase-4 component B